MLRSKLVILLAGVVGWASAGFGAVGIYGHAGPIVGPEAVPGYPGSFAATRVKVVPGGVVEFTRTTDAASAQFVLAAFNGTPLGTTDVLVYDPPAAVGVADGHLAFPNSIISAYQVNGPTEVVTLNSSTPAAIYLELAGIDGETDLPGHPNVIRVNSWALSATGDFEITKLGDSTSAALFLAAAQGTHFPSATVLFYDTVVPGPQADAAITFGDLLVSSFQTSGGGAAPAEDTVVFSFAAVPEPAVGILAAGVIGVWGRSRRK